MSRLRAVAARTSGCGRCTVRPAPTPRRAGFWQLSGLVRPTVS